MWKTLVLAAAVLLVTAAPELIPLRAAPEPKALPDARPAKPTPDTFAAVCRDDEVLNRPADPAWVSQSFIGDNCQAPKLPAVIDGAKASREKIVAGMAAAKNYAAAADAFQRCVSDFVAERKARNALSPAQVIIQNHRILVSQRAKETATSRMQMAIMAFNEYGSGCPM